MLIRERRLKRQKQREDEKQHKSGTVVAEVSGLVVGAERGVAPANRDVQEAKEIEKLRQVGKVGQVTSQLEPAQVVQSQSAPQSSPPPPPPSKSSLPSPSELDSLQLEGHTPGTHQLVPEVSEVEEVEVQRQEAQLGQQDHEQQEEQGDEGDEGGQEEEQEEQEQQEQEKEKKKMTTRFGFLSVSTVVCW